MTTPKKFIFVLMPFEDSFTDIYSFGIKQTCIDLNAYCERVDEQIFTERILDRIYNQISKADLVIADMTSRNANVFYEVGYAHGIGKHVILLTQNSDDIPFDLKHFPHIIYNGKIKDLNTQLKNKLEHFLNSDDSQKMQNFDFGLEFIIDGQKIEEGKEIVINSGLLSTWGFSYDIKMEIFNSSNKRFDSKFKFSFEVDKQYEKLFDGLEIIKPNEDKRIFISENIKEIYPQSYKSTAFNINRMVNNDQDEISINLKLKIFTQFEVREINFKLKLMPREGQSLWT